jgi:hypothetical protein
VIARSAVAPAPLVVTDGAHTVSPTTEIEFAAPIAVADLGGGAAGVSVPVFGPAGAGHHTGLVPDPGATAGPPVRFLSDDGTFRVPHLTYSEVFLNADINLVGGTGPIDLGMSITVDPGTYLLFASFMCQWPTTTTPGPAFQTMPIAFEVRDITADAHITGTGTKMVADAAGNTPASNFTAPCSCFGLAVAGVATTYKCYADVRDLPVTVVLQAQLSGGPVSYGPESLGGTRFGALRIG